MSTLGNLFNKAKAVEADSKPAAPPPPPPKTGFKIGGGTSPSTTAESVPGQSAPQPAPAPAPIRFGGPAPSKGGEGEHPLAGGPAPSPSTTGFKIGGTSPSGTGKPAEPEPVDSGSQAPESPAPAPRFADETPASQPQRELPADTEEAVKRFVENLEHLHTLTPEPDLATSAIRNIMVELKSNPQYIKHVMPNDVRVMIQMMRETMGLAKAVKEKKAATRKKASSAELQSVMDELSDLDNLV